MLWHPQCRAQGVCTWVDLLSRTGGGRVRTNRATEAVSYEEVPFGAREIARDAATGGVDQVARFPEPAPKIVAAVNRVLGWSAHGVSIGCDQVFVAFGEADGLDEAPLVYLRDLLAGGQFPDVNEAVARCRGEVSLVTAEGEVADGTVVTHAEPADAVFHEKNGDGVVPIHYGDQRTIGREDDSFPTRFLDQMQHGGRAAAFLWESPNIQLTVGRAGGQKSSIGTVADVNVTIVAGKIEVRAVAVRRPYLYSSGSSDRDRRANRIQSYGTDHRRIGENGRLFGPVDGENRDRQLRVGQIPDFHRLIISPGSRGCEMGSIGTEPQEYGAARLGDLRVIAE